jgi:hypothetical protein
VGREFVRGLQAQVLQELVRHRALNLSWMLVWRILVCVGSVGIVAWGVSLRYHILVILVFFYGALNGDMYSRHVKLRVPRGPHGSRLCCHGGRTRQLIEVI